MTITQQNQELKTALEIAVNEFRRIGYHNVDPIAYKVAYKARRLGVDIPDITPRKVLRMIAEVYLTDDTVMQIMRAKRRQHSADELMKLLELDVRIRPLPYIRFTYYHFCKEVFPKTTLKQIGYHCGLKDHSTVIHGNKTYADLVETDKEMSELHLKFCDLFGVKNILKLKK